MPSADRELYNYASWLLGSFDLLQLTVARRAEILRSHGDAAARQILWQELNAPAVQERLVGSKIPLSRRQMLSGAVIAGGGFAVTSLGSMLSDVSFDRSVAAGTSVGLLAGGGAGMVFRTRNVRNLEHARRAGRTWTRSRLQERPDIAELTLEDTIQVLSRYTESLTDELMTFTSTVALHAQKWAREWASKQGETGLEDIAVKMAVYVAATTNELDLDLGR